jgi:hypothetical protein
MWRWACWSFAAIVLFYIGTAVYLVMGRPSIKTDYLALVNERALAVPENERAWPLYREALAKMNNLNPVPKWSKENDLGPDDKGWPEAEAWLTEHVDALVLVRQAASRPEMGFPVWPTFESFAPADRSVFFPATPESLKQPAQKIEKLEDRWLVGTLLPQIQLMRNMSRMLAADARRAASAGDGDTAYADLFAILKMSHHCEEQPFLVSAFVASALQKLAYATIEEILAEHPTLWSNDQLRDLAHGVAAAGVDWSRSLEGERLWFYDIVQRLYTDDGNGNGRITDEGLRAFTTIMDPTAADRIFGLKQLRMQLGDLAVGAVAPASLYFMASREEVTEMHDRIMDEQRSLLGMPLWLQQEGSLDKTVNAWSAWEKSRYLPITISLPPLESMRISIERHRGERDGVLVGIALELYHRERGAWPETLAELASKYLPEVPFDRINGGPLGYRIAGDRPVVYSLGVDTDDDSGRLPAGCEGDAAKYRVAQPDPGAEDGDWVIWSTVRSED